MLCNECSHEVHLNKCGVSGQLKQKYQQLKQSVFVNVKATAMKPKPWTALS